MQDFQIYAEQALPPDFSSFIKVLSRLSRQLPLEQRPITQITVQVGNERETWEAARVVTRILERRHKGVPDHEIAIPADLLRQSQKTQQIFNIVMGAIAGISLLVGGIGIMNIMLATVTQRAREIGIRRCIGASRSDITRQFLLECLVITSLGGLLGIGWASRWRRLISRYAAWPTVVSGQAAMLALIVATGTGLVFGLYPAMRVAAIQPMEALASELARQGAGSEEAPGFGDLTLQSCSASSRSRRNSLPATGQARAPSPLPAARPCTAPSGNPGAPLPPAIEGVVHGLRECGKARAEPRDVRPSASLRRLPPGCHLPPPLGLDGRDAASATTRKNSHQTVKI